MRRTFSDGGLALARDYDPVLAALRVALQRQALTGAHDDLFDEELLVRALCVQHLKGAPWPPRDRRRRAHRHVVVTDTTTFPSSDANARLIPRGPARGRRCATRRRAVAPSEAHPASPPSGSSRACWETC